METLKRWFRFSPREQRGIWLFLLLALAIWGSPYVLPYVLPQPVAQPAPPDSLWQAAPVQNQSSAHYRSGASYRHQYAPRGSSTGQDGGGRELKLRPFDPNTADSMTWLSLGLSPRLAGRITRYRQAGGKFRSAEDLRRIWGLPAEIADQLIPWVRIGSTYNPSSHLPNSQSLNLPSSKPAHLPPPPININQADSSQWEALPGIGPTLARRVVQYRDKLGGFVRVEQVGELYGLADSIFQRIKPRLELAPGFAVRQLAINRVSQLELQAHPYIRFALAKQLIAYRQQHGAFRNVHDLKALQGVDPAQWDRILPYLDFSE